MSEREDRLKSIEARAVNTRTVTTLISADIPWLISELRAAWAEQARLNDECDLRAEENAEPARRIRALRAALSALRVSVLNSNRGLTLALAEVDQALEASS